MKPIRSGSRLAHLPCALAGEKLKTWRSKKQSKISPTLRWKLLSFVSKGSPKMLLADLAAAASLSTPPGCFHQYLTAVLVFPQIPAAASPFSPFTSEAELAPPSSGLGPQCKDMGAYPFGLWACQRCDPLPREVSCAGGKRSRREYKWEWRKITETPLISGWFPAVGPGKPRGSHRKRPKEIPSFCSL